MLQNVKEKQTFLNGPAQRSYPTASNTATLRLSTALVLKQARAHSGVTPALLFQPVTISSPNVTSFGSHRAVKTKEGSSWLASLPPTCVLVTQPPPPLPPVCLHRNHSHVPGSAFSNGINVSSSVHPPSCHS